MAGLFEGFVSGVADRLRQGWRNDASRPPVEIAKGDVLPRGRPADLFSVYGYDTVAQFLKLDQDLVGRYIDYEEMDDLPELSSALDIYADDITQPDTQLKRALWVTSPDTTTQEVVDDLFSRTLRYEDDLHSIARTLCKYGNSYEELLVTTNGVEGINYLPPATVRRIEGPKGQLFGFIQDFRGRFDFTPEEYKRLLTTRYQKGSAAAKTSDGLYDGAAGAGGATSTNPVMEDWEVVHFRLHTKYRRSTYGQSVLEPARWLFKRLVLLDDSALVFRLRRAPERRVFYVDVGDLPPREALAHVNQVRQQHRKKRFFNNKSGKLDVRYNAMAQDEDFYVPVRKGQEGSRIDVLQSPQWQSMEDIAYFQNKLWAAIKIPKAYMGQEEGVVRSILSSQDVRFARTVLRIQRQIISGSHQIGRVHMVALGLNPAASPFTVHMTVPSAIFELAQMEVLSARADLAGRMREHVSLYWILSEIFGMDDSAIEAVVKQREEEALRQARLEAEVEKIRAQGIEGTETAEHLHTAPRQQKGPPIPGLLPTSQGSGISEQQLFARRDRESEKRAHEKLDKLLAKDQDLQMRLMDLQGLVREVSLRRTSG